MFRLNIEGTTGVFYSLVPRFLAETSHIMDTETKPLLSGKGSKQRKSFSINGSIDSDYGVKSSHMHASTINHNVTYGSSGVSLFFWTLILDKERS